MKNLPKEFVGRTVRAILFIGLVVVFCTAISSAGLFLASRFGLTRSREQVPLTALSIGSQGAVTLPQRGRMVEGDGWKLRNSRDIYTLTLDNAVIEAGMSEAGPEPAVTVVGDLIIELKEDSGNWIKSEGVGILAESGTLVIRGTGSLNIEAGDTAIKGESVLAACRIEGGELAFTGGIAGVMASEIELAGGSGSIEAEGQDGVGIRGTHISVESTVGHLDIRGNAGALIAADTEPGHPSLRIADKAAAVPQSAGIVQLKSPGIHKDSGAEYSVITFSAEGEVVYDEETGCFEGAEKEIVFMGK